LVIAETKIAILRHAGDYKIVLLSVIN